MIRAVVVAVAGRNANAVESRSRRLEARWTALPKMETTLNFQSRDLSLNFKCFRYHDSSQSDD